MDSEIYAGCYSDLELGQNQNLWSHRDLGGIWNLDPLLKSASDSSLATGMAFYGFTPIPGGHFHACPVAGRGGGDLYVIYIQGNAYITTSLFL